jgi:MFS family permease
VGLGTVVFALIDHGATAGKSGEAVLLAAGAVVFLGFVVFESRATAPMVPLSLFGSRVFATTNVLTLLLYAALGAALYFLPFDLIQVQRYGATAAGASLLPFVVAISALSPVMGSLASRVGARRLLVLGPAVAGAGFALLALPERGGSYWTMFFPGIATAGIGMGITVAPLTAAVMGSVESHRAGVASGVNNAVARAAGLLAVAGLGVVLRERFDGVLDRHLTALRLPAALTWRVAAERTKLAGADLGDLDPAIFADVRAAFDDAYVAGFRALALTCALLAATAALAALALPASTRAHGTR